MSMEKTGILLHWIMNPSIDSNIFRMDRHTVQPGLLSQGPQSWEMHVYPDNGSKHLHAVFARNNTNLARQPDDPLK